MKLSQQESSLDSGITKYAQDRANLQQAFSATLGSMIKELNTNPIFINAENSKVEETGEIDISSGRIYYTTTTGNNGTIEFSIGTSNNGTYYVGQTLPTYEESATKATWKLGRSGNLILTVNDKIFDGVN